jgi:hypothetical protein
MLDEGVVSDMLTESVGLKLVPLAGEKVGAPARRSGWLRMALS